MAKHYYIGLSRKEIARLSYFPALEIKDKPNVDWIESVLIPLLLLVARRKNKKIREVPITFWAFTRQTARPFREELFLGVTPANLNSVAYDAIEKVLNQIQNGKVFAGLERLPEHALPICQILGGKVIRFYYGTDEIEEYMAYLASLVPASVCLYRDLEDTEKYYFPRITWVQGAAMVTVSETNQSMPLVENRDSEVLFVIHEDKN